jgi:hypothetical protein
MLKIVKDPRQNPEIECDQRARETKNQKALKGGGTAHYKYPVIAVYRRRVIFNLSGGFCYSDNLTRTSKKEH